MNDRWTLLLRALDTAFGSPDLTISRLKTEKQYFDNLRQEHQVHLVYAYKRSGEAPSIKREFQKKKVEKEEEKKAREQAMQQRKKMTYDLLQKINNNANDQLQQT